MLWLALPPYDKHAPLQVLARTAVFGFVAGWLVAPVIVEWLAGESPDDNIAVAGAVAVAWIVSVLSGLIATVLNLAMVDLRD